MAEIIPMIQAERASLATFLETLTPEQWTAPTACEAWNVQQLAGHLVAAAKITAGHFFSGFAMTGFNFDKFVDKDLRPYAEGTPAQVLDRFRSVVNSTRTPPGPKYVALGEIMVHGEDIRRALGSRGEHPAEHLTTLAEQYKNTGGFGGLRGKKRVAGLKLRATDVDWSTGDGPEVAGPAMSLILGMVGRKGALDDCTGPGVATLESRR
jgi:uncharacterized protein (TIGR03083 family)